MTIGQHAQDSAAVSFDQMPTCTLPSELGRKLDPMDINNGRKPSAGGSPGRMLRSNHITRRRLLTCFASASALFATAAVAL